VSRDVEPRLNPARHQAGPHSENANCWATREGEPNSSVPSRRAATGSSATRRTRGSPRTSRTFRVLAPLSTDIFLGAHGSYLDRDAKYARLQADAPAPFIDPAGYHGYVAECDQAFRGELARQREATARPEEAGE
jgi:hypothetical protein